MIPIEHGQELMSEEFGSEDRNDIRNNKINSDDIIGSETDSNQCTHDTTANKKPVAKEKRTTIALAQSTKEELRSALDFPKYAGSDEHKILYLIDKIKGRE